MLEAFNSLGFFSKLKAAQAYHSYRSTDLNAGLQQEPETNATTAQARMTPGSLHLKLQAW
jgi:hypothetical protein